MDNKYGFGGKKRDLKKNHKRSTGDVKRRDQGAKRRGLLALKARPGKRKRQKMNVRQQ